VVQVMYNTRAKSYNFVPDSSINSPQLQPWVEIELEDGQLLSTKLLVSNGAHLHTYIHTYIREIYNAQHGRACRYTTVTICNVMAILHSR